jgi:NAD(P)H dehydrogenase (quinone)
MARALVRHLITAIPLVASRSTIVVTAPNGKVGFPLFKQLVQTEDVRVVALARDAEKLRRRVDSGADAEILVSDYCDSRSLDAAFAKIDEPFRLFLACGNSPSQEEAEINLLDAAAATGQCEFVCKLSTLTAALEMKAGPYAAHLAVESALAKSQLPHSILRPNMFLQMLATPLVGIGDCLASAADAPEITCFHPFADASISMIDAEDVAQVAAALLRQPLSGSRAETFELTGPSAVSYADFGNELSRTSERQVRVLPRSYEEHTAVAPNAQPFLEVIGGASDVTDVVERILGRPPTSLAEFVERRRGTFGL